MFTLTSDSTFAVRFYRIPAAKKNSTPPVVNLRRNVWSAAAHFGA
jgi:hypothetical protein